MGRCTNVVNSPFVKKVRRDNLLDNLVEEVLLQISKCDLFGVLRRNDDGIDTERDGCTAVLLVLDGNLSLGVGAEPREQAGTTSGSHCLVQLVREDDSKRHKLLRLIRRIPKHDTLITRTVALEVTVVKPLSNIGRLLLDSDKDVARLVIETLLGGVVPDFLDRVANDFLVVQVGGGGDFAKDHDHASLRGGFAADFGPWVFGKASVKLERRI